MDLIDRDMSYKPMDLIDRDMSYKPMDLIDNVFTLTALIIHHDQMKTSS